MKMLHLLYVDLIFLMDNISYEDDIHQQSFMILKISLYTT